ncbi:MAG: DUF4080 domain-containing protein [Thiohalomonadales bacterium]
MPVDPSASIILCTLNAKYIHASLGLRYLYANMAELQPTCVIKEYTVQKRREEIAEELLILQPQIIGIGVYIWNTQACLELLAIIKKVAPEVVLVVGGPEISFETNDQGITQYSDYVICGQADLAFHSLCQSIRQGVTPKQKIIQAPSFKLDQINFPYDYYNQEDINNRVIYVEASRGCPYKCEFCLSSLDKTATPFALETFLYHMDRLYQRGVRHFKFVDRTFNLNINSSLKILHFFLDKADPDIFLHFELIPDHLPEKLKDTIALFPAGTLQFEIGIQSFNNACQALISRKQDNNRAEENLRWLRQFSSAHLHTDLIAGLPGEDMQSFAAGFDKLVSLDPHEIQVGLLKRLKGTPINRHSSAFAMVYHVTAPYTLLSNRDISFAEMQQIARFSRYWDLIANSGRFSRALKLILGQTPFRRFMLLSDTLFAKTGQTHKIELRRLFILLRTILTDEPFNIDVDLVTRTLTEDFNSGGYRKGLPEFVKQQRIANTAINNNTANRRQKRHQH